MKTPTPKPKAPEPMEITTGFYMTYDEVKWYIYNLAFKLLGNTRYWGKIGNFLW